MFTESPNNSLPISLIPAHSFDDWLAGQSPTVKAWLKVQNFTAKAGQWSMVPAADGSVQRVVVGLKDEKDWWAIGALPPKLPAGDYHIEAKWPDEDLYFFALAWGLGSYQFDRYKKAEPIKAQLVLPEEVEEHRLKTEIAAIYLLRDMINTPPEDFGPAELAQEAQKIADTYDASVNAIVGDDLLTENFPLVHAVGRAGSEPPVLIDFTWGDEAHTKVTLVGKGVCYDTGGLSIKPSRAMEPMKKDMGGAAHVLALAMLIMHAKLPVRLRVIIPAVENNVSANSIRPSDIVTARNGKTVEITNTDAEGRLVCADALALASEDKPELIVDFMTLTGACKVCMGAEVPAYFARDMQYGFALHHAGEAVCDIVWPLPLYQSYRSYLDTPIADLDNAPKESFGGTIFAALFLNEFIDEGIDWIHFDIMAANTRALPGRPIGGDAQGLRATFAWLKQRYMHGK